jgi:hypothetical protein
VYILRCVSTSSLISWVISSKTNGLMKQIIVLVLLLNCGRMVGQKVLPMPAKAQPGKGYVLCIEYDTSFSKKTMVLSSLRLDGKRF